MAAQVGTFWVFRAWGRIGTDIGGSKVERFASLRGARDNFRELFLEKTGNEWGTPKEEFEKMPYRFYPLDMDYGQGDDDESKQKVIIVSASTQKALVLGIKFYHVTS